MAFTIEDMRTISKEKYQMETVAGSGGWSNSISWILLIEDIVVLKDFTGKDLAVTTGFGFDTEEKLLELVKELVEHHASGLVVNTGQYIYDIPESVIRYCDENSLPLLTVPWSTSLYQLIKDMSMRVFLQSAVDEQISRAFIHIIEEPGTAERFKEELLPYFDADGSFQVVLISTGDLDSMDTVERRRLSYRMHIYLENITHNAHFFYYDACFVLVVNALSEGQLREIIEGFVSKFKRRMPGKKISVGVGSRLTGLAELRLAYRRARIAVDMALRGEKELLWFDQLGVYRLFSQVDDSRLLAEMGEEVLRPLTEHDRQHGTDYVETLELYLAGERSIQEVAKQTFTHRNTVIYRLNNIKKLLGCDLESPNDRLKYLLACKIVKMQNENQRTGS